MDLFFLQKKIFWRKYVTRLFWGTIDFHRKKILWKSMVPQNGSVSHILQISSFVFSRTKTFIQVWNYLRVSKWWIIMVNYPFKLRLWWFCNFHLSLLLYVKEKHEHSAKHLLLCSTEERMSYRFGMTWANEHIFGWTIPFMDVKEFLLFVREDRSGEICFQCFHVKHGLDGWYRSPLCVNKRNNGVCVCVSTYSYVQWKHIYTNHVKSSLTFTFLTLINLAGWQHLALSSGPQLSFLFQQAFLRALRSIDRRASSFVRFFSHMTHPPPLSPIPRPSTAQCTWDYFGWSRPSPRQTQTGCCWCQWRKWSASRFPWSPCCGWGPQTAFVRTRPPPRRCFAPCSRRNRPSAEYAWSSRPAGPSCWGRGWARYWWTSCCCRWNRTNAGSPPYGSVRKPKKWNS